MDRHEHEPAFEPNADAFHEDELALEEKEDIYDRALFRARMRMAQYIHLTAFATVIVLLAVINLLTTPKTLWVVWPFFGWGSVLGLHWILAPTLMKMYERIKDEEIEKELDRRK
jgi:hypothetical protein